MWKSDQPVPLESQYHYYMLLSFVICVFLALLVVVLIPRLLRRYRPPASAGPATRGKPSDQPDPWTEAGRRVESENINENE